MRTIKDAAAEFLASRRIAVTSVSRQPKSHGGNIVHQRLRERGYQAFAVNPASDPAHKVMRIFCVLTGGAPKRA